MRPVWPQDLLRWISDPRATHRVFDVVAHGYDMITAQATWRASAAGFTRGLGQATCPLILDLGAGPGNSASAMRRARPDARVVMLDRAPAMIQRAARVAGRQPWLAATLADAAHLPFPDATFDLVTGHSFLYLVPERNRVLAEARRTLKPGGQVAFLEPAAGRLSPTQWVRLAQGGLRFFLSMIGWRAMSGRHVRFSPAALIATLAAAGFADPTASLTLEGAGIVGRATRPKTKDE